MARRPFFTGFPGFRGSLPAPLLTQPPAAAPTIPRRSPGKIHPCILPGLQNCGAILHIAKSPSMAFYWLASTSKKYILGFFTATCYNSLRHDAKTKICILYSKDNTLPAHPASNTKIRIRPGRRKPPSKTPGNTSRHIYARRII